ncbi:MAG: Long-chain-fatty-acid--CoA ligase [Syntrophaceae bacterium PtaU1.Bin231]|nr:MAG: Long-chain-fatty-acid--CoA ligase [Syntrophaceae bacterium PtaU1.Bin231]
MLSPYSNAVWRDKNWPGNLPRELRFAMGERPLHEYLSEHARRDPERPALVFFNRVIRYREWDEMSNAFARFLLASGIRKGDRVALFLPTSPAFAVTYMGILKAGATVTACSPAFKEWELEYQLQDSGARILVSLDEYMATVQPVLKKVSLEKLVVTGHRDFLGTSALDEVPEEYLRERSRFPDTFELLDVLQGHDPAPPEVAIDLHRDVALIQYTGGTTGLPKGAMHTFYNVIYKTAAMGETAYYGLYEGKAEGYTLHMSPIYHIAGMLQFNSNVYRGLGQIFFPRFDPLLALQAIDRYKPEILMTTTPMNIAMMNHPDIDKYDLRSIRRNRISSLGIMLTAEIADRWRKYIGEGADVMEASYGLTETHTGDTFMPLDRPIKWGSMGIPQYGEEFKIVSFEDRNKLMPLGEMGEIAVFAPCNFVGYWNKPKETAETLVDGWVYTGDMGRFDEDGYLYFLGRKKEMIKVSGYSVFPEEVEVFINRHPAVENCGVKGVADAKKGEVIKAVVVLKEEFKGKVTSDEIIAWAKGKISHYKVPRIVEIRDSLPKSGTGKILRRML